MAGLFRGKKFTIRLLLVLLLVLLVVLIQIVSVSRISNPQPYPWEVTEPHDKRDESRNDETFKDKERGLRTVKPLVKQDGNDNDKEEGKKHDGGRSSPSTPPPHLSAHSTQPPPPETAPPSSPSPPIHFCYISSKDAVSAIKRAKTEDCRNLIRNITCQAQAGKLYDTSIKNTCPIGRNPTKAFQHVPYEHGVGPLPRVVYLLSVHGRAIRQIQRLFKSIYHSDHYYYIHVDKRSDYLYREINLRFSSYPNVFIPKWQKTTIWGGSSLLQMLLKAMEDIEFKLTHWKWDFFINLSESDYPLKSNDELVQFLRVHRKSNFVKTHGGDINKFIQKQGLDRTFVECEGHMWRISSRPLPDDITIDGGSDWIVINRNYSRYLVTSNDLFLKGLKKYYQYSLLPAESFFHTVLRNGPLCATLVRSNLHITNWNRKLGCLCQYKHIVDWCGCSPNDFLPKDMNRLKNPGNQNFFGRKFEAIVNQEVINDLHSHVYGAYPEETLSLSSYWQNVYHFKDTAAKPPSSLYTVYQSFLRLGLKLISKYRNETGCPALPSNPLVKEVNVYYLEDLYVGLIIKISDGPDGLGEQEILLTPNSISELHDQSEDISKRITSFEVGSEWDGKESIFRNYGGIIGVYDIPVAAVRLTVGKLGYITYIWENPLGIEEGRHSTKLEPSAVVNTNKLNTDRPLMPGLWKLRLELNSKVYKTLEFLVTPLYYDGAVPLSSPPAVNAKRMNHTDTLLTKSKNYKEWSHNVVKNGPELLNWIDQLVSRFWSVQAGCSVHEGRSSCSFFPSCQESKWSTYFPDPKSELGPVQSNGRIL